MTDIITIRIAERRDIALLKAVLRETELFPEDMLDEIIAGHLAGTSTDLWCVTEQSGDVIGFGFAEPERMTDGTWNLLALGVLPGRQGSGAGGAIVRWVEDHLRASGSRLLIVETMGTDAFASTRAFYEKVGYVQEARIRDFYEAGGDKIVYWKQL